MASYEVEPILLEKVSLALIKQVGEAKPSSQLGSEASKSQETD